jgi:hypothetical protein
MADDKKDTRTVMYRLAEDGETVEDHMFDSPDAVPKGEGWVDSPAKVGKVIKPKPFQKKTKAQAAVEDESE